MGNPAGDQTYGPRQATMVESRHFNNIIHAHTEAGHDLSGFFLFQRDVKTYQKKTEGGYQEGHFRIRDRWTVKPKSHPAWLGSRFGCPK